MAEIKPDLDMFAKIKVVGCGGGGNSAVNRMVQSKIKGVDFISINTDIQALQYSLAPAKINIGKTITRGLGAGMDPEIARRSAEESQNEIKEAIKGADMVFITAGMGGGTGSGSAPVVANIAKELGALTIAVVTKPFSFEGSKRMEVANGAMAELAKNVDTIITIPNDRILQIVDKKTTIVEAFALADEILKQGISGITEIITSHGLVNVDFADVKKVMKNAGSALMGVGNASGENKAVDAAKSAINSPLLEVSIDGAKGILFTVTGGPSLSMNEVNEAAKIVTESADPNAVIIFGAVIDPTMKDDIKVTVVATGFSDDKINDSRIASTNQQNQGFFMGGAFKKSDIFVDNEKPEVKPSVDQASVSTKDDELDIPAFIRKKMGE
ncbi:MAG: cell division protein FtsZ [Patescibacteria group bacterium]